MYFIINTFNNTKMKDIYYNIFQQHTYKIFSYLLNNFKHKKIVIRDSLK